MNAILLFRKTRKIIVLITMLMIIAGCGDKSVSIISTSEAYTKYERKTESKSLVVFSESVENPLKWFDSIPERRLLDALIEVSGIPFGLPGQMLEGGGNPWRGMVYGITNRAGWVKNPPHHLWKFFDEYKFPEREMLGYWDRNCPVRTDNPKIIASVFKRIGGPCYCGGQLVRQGPGMQAYCRLECIGSRSQLIFPGTSFY